MLSSTRTLAMKSALVSMLLSIAWVDVALAQPFTPESQALRESQVTPVPTVFQPRTGRLLVGVRGDVRAMEQTPGGMRDRGWVHTGPGNTVLRVRLDVRRDRLWVLDIGRVHVVDLVTNRRIRTVALPNWMFSAHEDLCLPDLALDAHGAAFVSSNVQPGLWRIDPDNFRVYERAVSLDAYRDLDTGFSALSIGEGGVMFAAMAAPGLLWRVDTDVFRAENIPLEKRLFGVCALENGRVARSRDFTLYALSVRDRYDVHRVTLAPRRTAAAVMPVPLGSAASRASLLASDGALYLAVQEASRTALQRRAARIPELSLKPIHREE